MTEIRDIPLREHDHATVAEAEVDDADLGRLRKLEKCGAIKLSEARKGWRIETRAVVGVVPLNQVRLIIEPKIAITGRTLMTWLSYAHNVNPVKHEPGVKRWEHDSTEGYFGDLVIHALVSECRTLLRGGLLRDYRRVAGVESAVRGRLDLTAQATREYGQWSRIRVNDHRREPDTWENLACSAALQAAASRTHDAKLAHDLAEIAALFPRLSPAEGGRARGTVAISLERATYTRVNRHYEPAHAWARLVLSAAGGVTDLLLDQGYAAQTMLLRMDRLWERVVVRMAEEAVAQLRGEVVSTKSGDNAITPLNDLSSHNPFRPDSLIRIPRGAGNCRIPLDAKYISYAAQSLSSDVIHQMLTYVSGYTDQDHRHALIVYPTAGLSERRTISFPAGYAHLGKIHALGVDVNRAPAQGVAEIRSVIGALL
jgi:5-methylcytosine-specific restriction enzyme subunit McrC